MYDIDETSGGCAWLVIPLLALGCAFLFSTPDQGAYWLAAFAALNVLGAAYLGLAWLLRTLTKPIGPKISREDPVFGLIEFRRIKTFSKRIREEWEGEIEFAPTNALIEITILASEAGPSERQRALFREIETRYSATLPAMLAALHANWEGEKLDYKLAGIEIAYEEKLMEWTAHFTVDWNEFYGMSFFVTLTDWKITDIMGVD